MIEINTQVNENGKISMKVNPPIPFPEYLQIQMSAIASAMDTTLQDAPEDIKQDIKDDIYGIFNMAAAAVLDRFDPNPTKHFATTLTEEAILKAENEIIEAKYKAAARKKNAQPKDHKCKGMPARD